MRPAEDPADELADAGHGLSDLVDRRAALRGGRRDGPELAAITEQLRAALGGSAPVVRRVGVDERALTDRLGAEEAVHPVAGPDDLADRLDDDRRLFVLEHPLLPGRPMNVVWVALTAGVPARIDQILDPAAPTLDPATADTAVFYSIWNAEPGLDGLGRGRDLIEGAVERLSAELPGLSTFITLSPILGFRAWAEAEGVRSDDPDLDRHCARYLTSLDPSGRPLDAAARFHLGNGARLWRINRDGDTSMRGLERSFGLMANYRYEPEDRAAHRARLADGTVVTSDAVASLLG